MKICVESSVETLRLGETLGRLAQPGDVFCLLGDLGAGKTTLAKGIGQGLGVKDTINSPTFTLIHEYRGRIPFFHMDLYRMGSKEEGEELGLKEYFWGKGLCAIEWPQIAVELLPDDILEIDVSVQGEARVFELRDHGPRSQQIVKEVSKFVDIEH